ncbi:MAG: AMP-dependent synthetase/ligase [Geminicoccaceae bacterium]
MSSDALAENLVATFHNVVAVEKDRPFLWAKKDGAYRSMSWNEVARDVTLVASALHALGLERGDRVLLVAENRPEWFISDLAVLQAGGITVPAYTTNTVNDHAFLIEHSGATIAICSSQALAKRLVPAIKRTDTIKALIFFEEFEDRPDMGFPVVNWKEMLELGQDSRMVDKSRDLRKDDLACFIYTSGTGGQPKGVMLSHGNILANIRGARELLKMVNVGDKDVFLSFLPLSHSYEHTAGQFFPMSVGAQIYYAEGVETLSNNLVEARPTILPCVPRLYEVLRARIMAGVKRQGGMKEKLFDMAVELGRQYYEKEGRISFGKLIAHKALDPLVRKKVQERFGGRLKAMVSGGAPLNYEVGLFFHALGLPVLQGYGQTEASPVISANVPGRSKIETVGPALAGVEVKIADDGEILVRGENVMKGYWKDEEATAAAISGGWLHTGDIGELDDAGRLRITDRKKDLIVNSGGDNISPQRVEGIVLLEPEIGQILVYGDKRPYLVALVVADKDVSQAFARKHKLENNPAVLREHPDFREMIALAMKRANTHLSTIERIRRYHLMNEPFTVDNGMMTPTLKLRRPIIIERLSQTIENLYTSGK